MEYLKFYEALKANRLITPIWKDVILLLQDELEDSPDKDDLLILILILFALADDGNICMSLNEETLLSKWNQKMEGMKILLGELGSLEEEAYDFAFGKSHEAIARSLKKIEGPSFKGMVGEKRFFEIEDHWLYIRKNAMARKSLISSLDRLFSKTFPGPDFDYKTVVRSFTLTDGQENVVKSGIHKNLVITGGPGTGKTTSILFLLLGLLLSGSYSQIYLLAPSGKAASRMKDSIKGGLSKLSDSFISKHKDLVDRIAELHRSTIHSALSIDDKTGAFRFNERNRLPEKSIFVIDEASMIDAGLFASLLSAIPDDARVFIMGDKNQLPSVDAGAVFGELMVKKSLLEGGNICELGEAVRFKVGSPIYELANAVNNDAIALPTLPWRNEFLSIQPNVENVVNPVYYYSNPIPGKDVSEKEIIQHAVKAFGEAYFADLQEKATDLDPDNPAELAPFFAESVKRAEILTAENRGVRGVDSINAWAKSMFIDKNKPTSVDGFYPGELMMVTKNNKLLDLANGDSGILVTFKGDKTLYFMIEKDSQLIKTEGKVYDKIFRLDGYMFYPFHMITRSEITSAYAITIHKSQGSDYKNILVILPTKKGHPLLNRQIVYTAITRTKGDTYILSNQERVLEAKNTLIVRDTNIK